MVRTEKQRKKKQKGLFRKAKSDKYSKIVKTDTHENARESVNTLEKEFNQAKTRSKKVRILRVLNYTANRLKASSKNPRYKPKTRKEKKNISEIYRSKANRLSSRLD